MARFVSFSLGQADISALVAIYGGMLYVSEVQMDEREPARRTSSLPKPDSELTPVWLLGSALAVAAGQAVLFVASQPLCEVS